jgi:hypothetical protein
MYTASNKKFITDKPVRSISSIAIAILAEWEKPYFGAKPYLSAMLSLDSIDDKYGLDDARNIILYFLSNAKTFRGEKAKALKLELKQIAGIK